MADFTTKCPHCQTVLQVSTQLIGQLVKCPACSNRFSVMHPAVSTPPVQYSTATSGERKGEGNTLSLVLGILSILIPIPAISFPVGIIGLILSVRKKYTVGIVLSAIGLGLGAIYAVLIILLFL